MLQKIEPKNQVTNRSSFSPDIFDDNPEPYLSPYIGNLLSDEINKKIYELLLNSDRPLGAVEIAMSVEIGVVDAKQHLHQLHGLAIEFDSYRETYQVLRRRNDHRRNTSDADRNERQLQESENAQSSQSLQANGTSISTHSASRSNVGSSLEVVREFQPKQRGDSPSEPRSDRQSSIQLGSPPQSLSEQNRSQDLSTTETRSHSCQEERLYDLEATIARGLKAFYEVGMSLLEIRESKLYTIAGFSQFEAYCQERWGIKRTYAFYQMNAAIVVNNLKTFTNGEQKIMGTNGEQNTTENKTFTNGEHYLPTNERQVRPLTKLPKEKQIEAWKKAVQTAPHGRITAEHISKTVKKMLEPLDTKTTKQPNFYTGDRVISDRNELFTIVEDRDLTVLATSWKDTPCQLLIKAEIKPVSNEQITVCANLSVEQLAILQQKYSSLDSAIEDLLNGN